MKIDYYRMPVKFLLESPALAFWLHTWNRARVSFQLTVVLVPMSIVGYDVYLNIGNCTTLVHLPVYMPSLVHAIYALTRSCLSYISGFADSTGYPSEQGVVEDSLTAYNYIRSLNSRISVYVWGHSLGTGYAFELVSVKK